MIDCYVFHTLDALERSADIIEMYVYIHICTCIIYICIYVLHCRKNGVGLGGCSEIVFEAPETKTNGGACVRLSGVTRSLFVS